MGGKRHFELIKAYVKQSQNVFNQTYVTTASSIV